MSWTPPKPLPPSPRTTVFPPYHRRFFDDGIGNQVFLMILPGDRRLTMTDEELRNDCGFTKEWRELCAYPPTPAPSWKCMCEGCGAPFKRMDVECSYCGRATGLMPTPRGDWADAVSAGSMTINEARAQMGRPSIITSPDPISDEAAERLRREWARVHTRSTGPR